MNVKKMLIDWSEPKLEELGCFLVDVKVDPSHARYALYIDKDGGVSIGTCETMSRYLEMHLDNTPGIPKDYTLEVSSPGLDNPFMVKRQYSNSIGKEVEVLMKSGVKKEGKLLSAGEESIRIAVEVPLQGKKYAIKTEEEDIPFSAIKSTKKKITF